MRILGSDPGGSWPKYGALKFENLGADGGALSGGVVHPTPRLVAAIAVRTAVPTENLIRLPVV
jgi:hypothetical protein